jgi:hypothetical protein
MIASWPVSLTMAALNSATVARVALALYARQALSLKLQVPEAWARVSSPMIRLTLSMTRSVPLAVNRRRCQWAPSSKFESARRRRCRETTLAVSLHKTGTSTNSESDIMITGIIIMMPGSVFATKCALGRGGWRGHRSEPGSQPERPVAVWAVSRRRPGCRTMGRKLRATFCSRLSRPDRQQWQPFGRQRSLSTSRHWQSRRSSSQMMLLPPTCLRRFPPRH